MLETEQNYSAATEKLYNLLQKIQTSKENKELYSQALETYCKILLNIGGTENAQKVVDLSTEKNVPTLKARAYWMLSKRVEAIDQMLKAENLTEEDANFCTIILKNIGSNLDELAETADKNFLENCINLAEKLNQQHSILDAELLTLEFQTVQVDGNCPETLKTQIENIRKRIDPKNHDFLRLYARFHTKNGNFEKACNLWSELASATNSRNTDFWPAKYYQLLCLSKISEKDRQKASHAVEVLLSSRKDIPQFWRKKLLNLITQ
jgi:primosomal protein N''